MWCLRFACWAALWGQCGQENGLSPVWVLRWRIITPLSEDLCRHIRQLYLTRPFSILRRMWESKHSVDPRGSWQRWQSVAGLVPPLSVINRKIKKIPFGVLIFCRLEFICEGIFLRIFVNVQNPKIYSQEKFQWLYCDYSHNEFSQTFLITKSYPSKFPGIFANIFQCKIIPVYSIISIPWSDKT